MNIVFKGVMWCHFVQEELRMRAYTRAYPPFPSVFPLSPSPSLPYEAYAAAGDSGREGLALQRLCADVAAAAAAEQPRGCQRRNPRTIQHRIGEIGPQQRLQREKSRTRPRAGGLCRSEQRARRPAVCRHLHRRARIEHFSLKRIRCAENSVPCLCGV